MAKHRFKRVTFDEYVKMASKELRAKTGIHPVNPFPHDPEFTEGWLIANQEVHELARIAAHESIQQDNLIFGGK